MRKKLESYEVNIKLAYRFRDKGVAMKCPKYSLPVMLGTAASMLLTIVSANSAQAGDYNLTLNGSPIYERLDATDDYLVEDNSYIDTYTFTGEAGQRVVITMSSQELDSYLILLDPSGNSLDQDDDSADNLDARIEVVLPADGTYTVYANSYGSNAAGAYTIQANIATGQPLAANVVSSPTSSPSPSNPSSSTQSRYFCDETGNIPLTMARSRRTNEALPLIQWTSDWAPAPYSPAERCQAVSDRLETVQNQFDRLILTAGTLNGQPVVCAASDRDDARQGLCAAEGLVLTARSRGEAEELIRGLRTSFTQLVAGTSPDILPAANLADEGVPYIDLSDF